MSRKLLFALVLLLAAVAVGLASYYPGNKGRCVGRESTAQRLYLQQLTDTSVIIKWRGDASAACIGTLRDRLDIHGEAVANEGGHKEVVFTGLAPQTTYFYSVGAAGRAPDEQVFRTAPESGQLPQDGNTRVWLIGDSGTGSDDEPAHAGEAAAVLAGMETFVAKDGEPVDVFIMLGDNAYNVGSDRNYQQAVFEVYPRLLKSLSLWPTIGNHEMGLGEALPLPGFSQTADPGDWVGAANGAPAGMPYLDIFSLPTRGEAGGLPSGSEQYYSFDHGNVHFVSLDSQLTARDPNQRAAMKTWLIDDLAANASDWTIVFFHHPPYSKGANHDSDDTEKLGGFDMPQQHMREEFVPVFDKYGVDLVYSGHSHSYERSYYLRNLVGKSDTYSPAVHAELVAGDPERPASGRDGEPYHQLSPTSGGVDDRVVYTVAGNGGKADADAGKLTAPDQWLRHVAHVEQPADTVEPRRHGLAVIGSVVVDAGDRQLVARFIDAAGEVLDRVIINREPD